MPRIAMVLALFCLSAAAPAGAAQPRWLGSKPFKLTADHNAKKPNVAVDAAGTGHFAWDVNRSGDDPLVYCRVPRGARACQHQTTIPLPLESFGEPQVLLVGPAVVLVAHRCCGPGEGTYAVVSTDGGTTFAPPRVIGDIEPGQAVAWPGTDMVALADDVVTAGVSFQAASLSGAPATTSALVGNGVSQDYDGTIGFAGQTTPLVAFDDLHHGFWRLWSGAGDVNDVATWGPIRSLGALTELRIATGPAGVVLMAKRHFSHPFADQYVARRYDPATATFKPAAALSSTGVEDDVIFRDVFEDPGGHVEAVWVANGTHGGRTDPIRLRVSGHGGATWRAERTLVRATNDTGFNLQVGAAADGGGFVTYDGNDAGPLWAVPIPKLSAQH